MKNAYMPKSNRTTITSNSKNPMTKRTLSGRSNNQHHATKENEEMKTHRKFDLDQAKNSTIKVQKAYGDMSSLSYLTKVNISDMDLLKGFCMNGMPHPSRNLDRKTFDEF